MIKELLFGKKLRSIMCKTDKVLKRLVEAPVEDFKDIYKITADSLVKITTGVSKELFTPENIKVIGELLLNYYGKNNSGLGVTVTKKF